MITLALAVLLTEPFNVPNGLVTNEYAYRNPASPEAKKCANWEVTSGSLFASGGQGWTGAPDDKKVDARSTEGTNSAMFRMTSARKDFGNVAVSFKLLNQRLRSSSSVPAQHWDGVHLWLRYQSPYQLYMVSVNRRDNTAVIKKKVPGGPSNGGTYYDLSAKVPNAVPYGKWQDLRAEARTNPSGSVTLRLFSGGRLVVQAVDDGKIGGTPIVERGGVGLRADNAELKLDDLVVTSLGDGLADPTAPIVRNARVHGGRARWSTSEPSTSQVQWGPTETYGSTAQDQRLKQAHAVPLSGLKPGEVYHYKITSRNEQGRKTVTGDLTFTAPAGGGRLAR